MTQQTYHPSTALQYRPPGQPSTPYPPPPAAAEPAQQQQQYSVNGSSTHMSQLSLYDQASATGQYNDPPMPIASAPISKSRRAFHTIAPVAATHPSPTVAYPQPQPGQQPLSQQEHQAPPYPPARYAQGQENAAQFQQQWPLQQQMSYAPSGPLMQAQAGMQGRSYQPTGSPPVQPSQPNGPASMLSSPASFAPPASHSSPQAHAHPGAAQQSVSHARPYGAALAPAPAPKLDPRQIPSPINVQSDDQAYFDKHHYVTSTLLPMPLSTTDFAAIDDGNSNPKFLRPSLKEIPCHEDLLSQTAIPFGVAVQPFATLRPDEKPIPLVDTGKQGPIRCERCKAYINPFAVFTDSGRKFTCSLCKFENPVPQSYFCNLDASGRRCDLAIRPELCYGTVELTATKDYCNRVPARPALLFLVDVNVASVQCGLVNAALRAIKSYISAQEGKDVPEKVAVMTYDRAIHFYSFSSENSEAEMRIITDIDEPFVPVNPIQLFQSYEPATVAKMLSLLEKIPSLFRSTTVTLSSLGSALTVAAKTMESTGGRIIVFQNNLPNFGPGSVAARDEAAAAGSEKERSMFFPQTEFYQALGESFSSKGISVDLFLCPTAAFVDIATLGLVASVTGGQTHAYFSFRPDKDELNIIRDIQWSLYKPYGFDSVTRVRVGNGLLVREYFGNYNMRNATDIEYARLDADQTFAFSLKYDGKLADKDRVCIQVAVLYTDPRGERRIRLHNLCLSATAMPANVFKSSDIDATICLLLKSAISHCSSLSLAALRHQILERTTQILAGYRKLCSAHSSSGQLILPEALKLLPMFTLCLIKGKLFRDGRDIAIDKRIHLMRLFKGMACAPTISFLYPRLYLIGSASEPALDGEDGPELYNAYRKFSLHSLTSTLLDSHQVYLLENGIEIIVWIGNQVSRETLKALFDVNSLDQVPVYAGMLPYLASPLSKKAQSLLASIELLRQRSLPIQIVRQQMDSQESEFIHYMVEDKGHFGTDYLDFLCQLHNQIQVALSG